MKKYKPLVDKLYWIVALPLLSIMAAATVFGAFTSPIVFALLLVMDAAIIYLLLSPLFGYVLLCEREIVIRFGFILKKRIPYDKIRKTEKVRRFYSDSMLSLKNATEHVNIRYNSFDVVSVSVVGNDDLIAEISTRV